MVSQGRGSGLAWTFSGVPLLDVPTFMRYETLQEPYCVRLSGTVASLRLPQIDMAEARTVREYLAKNFRRVPCATITTTVRGVSSLERDSFF
jgi:hypothetical protein